MAYKVIRQKPIIVDRCDNCPFLLRKRTLFSMFESHYCKLAMNVNKEENCEIYNTALIPPWCMLEDWKPEK
jgi:hypothetical protein